jgi:hypothetical protein
MQLPQILFLVWMAWAALGCFTSDWPLISIEGLWMRCEGLLTWVILLSLGYFYWTVFETIYPLALILFGFCMVTMPIMAIMFHPKFQTYILTDMAMSSIMSMTIALFFACNPVLVVIPMIMMYHLGNRTAFFAPIIGCISLCAMCPSTFVKRWRVFALALGIIIVGILLSPARERLMKVNLFELGGGCRGQWIVRAGELSKALPLTGFGLDTQSRYLGKANAVTMEPDAVSDRVHNIILDILLQTGWTGLTIWLLCLGACVGYTVIYGGIQNRICLALIVTWFTFGLINPQGIFAHAILCIAIMGIRRPWEPSSSLSSSPA